MRLDGGRTRQGPATLLLSNTASAAFYYSILVGGLSFAPGVHRRHLCRRPCATAAAIAAAAMAAAAPRPPPPAHPRYPCAPRASRAFGIPPAEPSRTI